MKAQRPYPRATITPKGEHALAKGHPWVYEAEVLFMEGAPGQGARFTLSLPARDA